MDKAPLRRGSSTPACLAELARVRSDTRTDGGAGVGRLGVIGPAVDRLVNLLLVSCEYVVTGTSPTVGIRLTRYPGGVASRKGRTRAFQ